MKRELVANRGQTGISFLFSAEIYCETLTTCSSAALDMVKYTFREDVLYRLSNDIYRVNEQIQPLIEPL